MNIMGVKKHAHALSKGLWIAFFACALQNSAEAQYPNLNLRLTDGEHVLAHEFFGIINRAFSGHRNISASALDSYLHLPLTCRIRLNTSGAFMDTTSKWYHGSAQFDEAQIWQAEHFYQAAKLVEAGIPDIELVFSFADGLYSDLPIPVVHQCNAFGFATILPMWTAPLTSALIRNESRYRQKHYDCRNLSASLSPVPWLERPQKLYWRGLDRTYGGRVVFGSSMGVEEFPSKLELHPRLVFPHLSLQHADIIDVFLCGNHIPRNVTGTSFFRMAGLVRECAEWPEYIRSRYLLYLPGNICSERLPKLFLSGSLVFLVDDWIVDELFKLLLRPWVHYVPVRADGTDVVAKVVWAIKNDDMARAIAERGLHRARFILSCKMPLVFTALFLDRYAQVFSRSGDYSNSSYVPLSAVPP